MITFFDKFWLENANTSNDYSMGDLNFSEIDWSISTTESFPNSIRSLFLEVAHSHF